MMYGAPAKATDRFHIRRTMYTHIYIYIYIYMKRPFGSDEIDFHSYAARAENVWKMTIKTNARVLKTTCAFDKITFSAIQTLPRKCFSVYYTLRTVNRKYTNYRRVRTLTKPVVFWWRWLWRVVIMFCAPNISYDERLRFYIIIIRVSVKNDISKKKKLVTIIARLLYT